MTGGVCLKDGVSWVFHRLRCLRPAFVLMALQGRFSDLQLDCNMKYVRSQLA